MKKISLLLILMCSIFIHTDFKKSKEEEFQEGVDYEQVKYPEKDRTELENNLKALVLEFADNHIPLEVYVQKMKNLSKQNDLYELDYQCAKDLLEIFNLLKKKMHIPDEVTMLLRKNGNVTFGANNVETKAAYYSGLRAITIPKSFFSLKPTISLAVLIHELTHCQQHMRLGITAMFEPIEGLNSDIVISSFEIEREADENIFKAVRCPMCLQAIEDAWEDDQEREKNGYLNRKAVSCYKKQAQLKDLCEAHSADTNDINQFKALFPKSDEALSKEQEEIQRYERLYLDRSISSLQDRLSSMNFE